MGNWDDSFDVVVIGSGSAGFAAAMAAADEGLSAVICESTDRWGGSSAMSGGGMWLPNNPVMQREGVGDSRDEALAYMEATIRDAGPATSRVRKEAFVDSVADFVNTAESFGMKFSRGADYPDYYPELPGGKIGRALEVEPLDAHAIGDWWASSRGQDGVAFPVMTNDVWLLARSWVTPAGMARGAKVVGRVLGGAVKRQQLVACGAALMASFLDIVVVKRGTPLWLSSPLAELVVEDGRVTGVVVTRDGQPRRVEARRGVVLTAGGFDYNGPWREKYTGVKAGWSSGNKGNLGRPIEIAMDAGAATDLMDDAWWGGSVPPVAEGGQPGFIVQERSMPFSIMTDAAGSRFANESESYVDLGHHMLAHPVQDAFWLISDARHSHRYLRTYALDPRGNKAMAAAGIMHKAGTLAELASAIGADATTLRRTVDRFNGFARAGVDGDFGRGNSAYDRYYGDPTIRPNPNLGPIEKAPFTAVRVVPGDLGTKGGVLTDEFARALRPDGSVFEGLYAAGNNSASVMGRTYPGPGSTIGPAVVFGLRAVRHMAAV